MRLHNSSDANLSNIL